MQIIHTVKLTAAAREGGLLVNIKISVAVRYNPCSNGSRLTIMMMETTMAAVESALSGDTPAKRYAIAAATKTAILLIVSAQTC
jgi:hypothetical protein